jgi:hypothetical protein
MSTTAIESASDFLLIRQGCTRLYFTPMQQMKVAIVVADAPTLWLRSLGTTLREVWRTFSPTWTRACQGMRRDRLVRVDRTRRCDALIDLLF